MTGDCPTPECPICSVPGQFVFSGGDIFYEVTKEQVDLYRCSLRGCLFQWPVPDAEAVAGFYPSGYWREEKSNEGWLSSLQRRYVDWMLGWDLMRWISRLQLPKEARVLDVGCSRGDWLARIRAKGYRVAGLEADARAADYARRVYGLAVSEVGAEDWSPMPASFEAITFFHLLEHLREPARFLARCHQALTPDGKLLLRVPNIHSWQAHLTGRRWKGLELPRHLVLFSPQSLSAFLEQNGFAVERLDTWSLRDGPPAMTSSLFPRGEPTRQVVLGRHHPFSTLIYLLLTWVLTPWERLAAWCGRGSMITVIARRLPPD